jgi:methyl-accepting chemotaxis protein
MAMHSLKMNFFKNMSIGLKFFTASLLIVAVLFSIGWWSVNTIIECHHACTLLLGGAVNTKSLAQSAQASFYMLTEKADRSLLYAQFGDRLKSEDMERQFSRDAQTMITELGSILNALNADPLVDKSLIAPLAEKTEAAINRLNNEYVPLIQQLSKQTAETEAERQKTRGEFEQAATVAVQLGQDIDDIWRGISGAGDGVYTGYVAYLEGMILQHQIFLIAGVIASLLLVLILAYFIHKPFKSMMNVLDEIRNESDLTKRFAVYGRDEVGKLSEFCNQTFEKIKNMVTNIKNEADALSGIGSDLSANMNQTATAVNEINANIQNIKGRVINQSASVSETHATMENLVQNINKLDDHVGNQSNNISQATAAIEQMVANINSVTGTLVSNTGNVQTLKEASEVGRNVLNKFGAIDSSVRTVAEQEDNIRNAMEEQGAGSKQILESATQEIISGMNEMASGAEQINLAINHVNEISAKNRQAIDVLIKEVSQFKVD